MSECGAGMQAFLEQRAGWVGCFFGLRVSYNLRLRCYSVLACHSHSKVHRWKSYPPHAPHKEEPQDSEIPLVASPNHFPEWCLLQLTALLTSPLGRLLDKSS